MSVPVSQFNGLQSQLVLVMEVRDIFSDLYDVMDEDSEFYVYDRKGELIFGSGNQYEERLSISKVSELQPMHQDGKEVYGMVCQSDDKAWKLKVCIPDLLQRGKLDSSTQSVWLLMVVPLVASVLCCMYFTYRNHREIQEILLFFNGQKKSADKSEGAQGGVRYKVIREHAEQIVNENMKYKESIPELEYLRKYEILDKLVRKTYKNEEEITNALNGEELSIQNGKCVVLCFRYKGSGYRMFVSENMTIKDFVKGQLSGMIERKVEIFDTSSRETICILSVEDADINEIVQDIITRLNVEVVYRYQIDVEIGVGNVVDSLFRLSESYWQARMVIKYKETAGKSVYLYSELAQLEDVYYYPSDYDEKIFNYIVVGKKEEAKEIIGKLYKENFEDSGRMLTVNAMQVIKRKLMASLGAVYDKYGVSGESMMTELSNQQNMQQFFDKACEIVDLYADKIVSKKKLTQQSSSEKIMEYINEHYSDNMLSVKHISQIFGLHENHVSRLFRDAYGENLSAVIERRRMEKACELIKNTDMKIAEIAEAVGYTSDISFRRVFKRVTGMSPGEYRGK